VKQINYTGRNSLPGDLAVRDGHVAMVVGNGMMIEASYRVQRAHRSARPESETHAERGGSRRLAVWPRPAD